MPQYDVNIYAVVRLKVVNVEADSMEEAIAKSAEDANYSALHRDFCECALHSWEKGAPRKEGQHAEYIEYADEVTGYLVDVVGDRDYAQSRNYAADGVTVE